MRGQGPPEGVVLGDREPEGAVLSDATSMSVIVYSYGARAPIKNGTLCEEQMALAHAYKNKLVEIERRRRSCVRIWRDRRLPRDLVEREARLVEDVEAALAAVHAARSGKGKKADVSAPSAALRALRAERAEVRAAMRPLREALKDDARYKERLRWINRAALGTAKAARAACGLYWGTYLQVEDAVEQAKEPPKQIVDDGRPPTPWHLLPHFRAWDGVGKIAVQIQGGMPTAEALTCRNTRLQIERISDAEWDRRLGIDRSRLPEVSTSRAGQRAIVRLRAGSGESRGPIWVEVPVRMDRPLPEIGNIKWAWLLRRPVGPSRDRLIPVEEATPRARQKYATRTIEEKDFVVIPPKWDWQVQVVMEVPAAEIRTGGAVALDIGWRRLGEGFLDQRSGYWVGSDGRRGEVLLPEAMRDDIERVEARRAARDRARDAVITQIRAFASPREDVPEWLGVAVGHMDKWRGSHRLSALLRIWHVRRFEGDEGVFRALDAWDRRDRLLWTEEASLRERILRARREVYRVIAARLARQYAELVLGDFDIRPVAAEAPAEEAPRSQGREQRRSRVLGAPHQLRAVASNAFRREGGRVTVVPDVDQTQKCALCGCTESWNAAPSHLHTCTGCRATWDQDDNHGLNLLRAARGGVASRDAPPLAEAQNSPQKTPGRRARMRQKKTARGERADSAS